MKKCPFCAEEIQDEAVVCRFCGRDLKPPTEEVSSSNQNMIPAPPPPKPDGSQKITTNNVIVALVGVLAVLLLVFALTSGGSPRPAPATSTPALPPHTVAKNTDIGKGRRIEIHVTNANLTKDECLVLLKAYVGQAQPNGQVSVRKPDAYGGLSPWCVDNLDGSGPFFNDELFK